MNQKSVIFVILVFLHKSFKFQRYVYSDSHDLLMMSTNPNDFALLNITNRNYCCIISRITKSEAVNLLQNAHLTKKMRHKI